MSARVGKGLIGVRSLRGIERYRFRSVCMAIEVSRKKKADTSPGTGRYPLESGKALLQSARVWPGPIAIRQSPEGPHWNPLQSGRASLESTGSGVINSVNLDG